MDFRGFHGTALLAPRVISFERVCPKVSVFFRIQFESGSFLADASNSVGIAYYSNLGLSLGQADRARKSAQIISKQQPLDLLPECDCSTIPFCLRDPIPASILVGSSSNPSAVLEGNVPLGATQ
jgi:hypothetical protein